MHASMVYIYINIHFNYLLTSHTFIIVTIHSSKSGEINIVICRNVACMTPITWYESILSPIK